MSRRNAKHVENEQQIRHLLSVVNNLGTYTDADAVAAVASADDYVKNDGDTMTDDLTIDKAAGSVNMSLKGIDDSSYAWYESGGLRVTITYNAGSNYVEFRLFQSGDVFLWKTFGNAEKMRLDTDKILLNAHMQTRDGHSLFAYSSGNDKVASLGHNDTDTILRSSSGAIKSQSTELNVRNIADDDYVDVNANAFNVSPKSLPTDPENWKDLLPEFLKKEVVYPIKEAYDEEVEREVLVDEYFDTGTVDKKGNPIMEKREVLKTVTETLHKYRKIGEETRTFVSIDLIARLALQKVEALEQEIEDLKKIIEVTK